MSFIRLPHVYRTPLHSDPVTQVYGCYELPLHTVLEFQKNYKMLCQDGVPKDTVCYYSCSYNLSRDEYDDLCYTLKRGLSIFSNKVVVTKDEPQPDGRHIVNLESEVKTYDY